jgi:hypothetical protein
MTQTLARLLCTAALGAAVGMPVAHANTIDFEPAALTGLYFPGDSFSQSGYTLTTQIDFGIIDSAVALGSVSPTGNATQFYFNSNDGLLRLVRSDAGLFSLDGFSAAFVPLDPASLQTTVIVAVGIDKNNTQVSSSWGFASSTTSHFPFTAYAGATFAAFTDLEEVDFYACSLVGNVACSEPTMNNGQFAIDDILVTATATNAMPEPATVVLVLTALGVFGLGRARPPQRALTPTDKKMPPS